MKQHENNKKVNHIPSGHSGFPDQNRLGQLRISITIINLCYSQDHSDQNDQQEETCKTKGMLSSRTISMLMIRIEKVAKSSLLFMKDSIQAAVGMHKILNYFIQNT